MANVTLDKRVRRRTPFDVVEASISDLQQALTSEVVTSVDLVAEYLLRISVYDCRGPQLNSIPILNTRIFDEAAASDERRARGQLQGLLDGIPYTVKDSYAVAGMTVASGSPAFEELVATEDAFTVAQLRKAGAVLLGKTNMPPMAAGGMQRGVYGRAESPYNKDYLAAAFASGSSNGSGVATAASFAAFGMGEETVSSGRSPASNNALIAYTPSRGNISIRGNWPLYPTCDVVVPHTRTMDDLFEVLEAISVEDDVTVGDFWRAQSFLRLPKPWPDRPRAFRDLAEVTTLEGLRIAVPAMYTGEEGPGFVPGATPVYTSSAVKALWQRARDDLTRLGAIVEIVQDFPAVTKYENSKSSSPTQAPEVARLPDDWNSVERGLLIALAWKEYLSLNKDCQIPGLTAIDESRIWPAQDPDNPQLRFSEPANAIHWTKLKWYLENAAENGNEKASVYEVKNLPEAVKALEALRKQLFEDWMLVNRYDLVAFPAVGDVGRADADVSYESAKHAWTNGVKYSNGNRALRHLGIPTVTVPMGVMQDKDMPVGLTFASKAYSDVSLLGWANAFEKYSKRRTQPKLTPTITLAESQHERIVKQFQSTPRIILRTCTARRIKGGNKTGERRDVEIKMEGELHIDLPGKHKEDNGAKSSLPLPRLEVIIDGQSVPSDNIDVNGGTCSSTNEEAQYEFTCRVRADAPPVQEDRNRTEAVVARDQMMVMILARSDRSGRPSGHLEMVGLDD